MKCSRVWLVVSVRAHKFHIECGSWGGGDIYIYIYDDDDDDVNVILFISNISYDMYIYIYMRMHTCV